VSSTNELKNIIFNITKGHNETRGSFEITYYTILCIKGVVHLKNKKKIKTFADNLLNPMSSKISMSFFLMKTFQDFSPFNGLQWEPNGSRSN